MMISAGDRKTAGQELQHAVLKKYKSFKIM